jgi:hypothetical protein
MATKKLKDGGPCAENETYINGKCVKMNFFNNPAGIGAIGAALTGIGAAIKKKRANTKEAKAEAAQFMKEIKSVSSKSKMKVGGMVNSNKKITPSKTATGRVGGTSKAPKTAVPKAKMGGSTLKKAMYGTAVKPNMMAKPSMMKKGGTKKK